MRRPSRVSVGHCVYSRPGGDSANYISDFCHADPPSKRAETETVSVEVKSVLPTSDRTHEVEMNGDHTRSLWHRQRLLNLAHAKNKGRQGGLVIYDLDMSALKPETALLKRLETLERHKEMMDSLATFLKAHPTIAAKCSIHPLQGKLGLKFDEYALVVPYVKKGGGFVLKLIKSGDDWRTKADSDDLVERVASEDVSNMSEVELEKLLDSVNREINPDADEENGENGEEDDPESMG